MRGATGSAATRRSDVAGCPAGGASRGWARGRTAAAVTAFAVSAFAVTAFAASPVASGQAVVRGAALVPGRAVGPGRDVGGSSGGMRPRNRPVPPFAAQSRKVTSADVRYLWHPGCPVGASSLRMLHMRYWGFDARAHMGWMLVNEAVVPAVLVVFSTLYRDRFPIRRMVTEEAFRGSDPAAMAADDTSGFNCRAAVAPGPPQWSVHAYGEAIDVNTVENPYVEGGAVQPAAGAAYLDRAYVRPGMAVAGGVLVRAFAEVGWKWGGRWTATPDYQHFSATGG